MWETPGVPGRLWVALRVDKAHTVMWMVAGSGAQSCPSLCNPVDCSMPGFSVLHYLLEFAQTHVH